MFEIIGDNQNTILSQLSFSTFDSRETINAGLIYRTFNANKTVLYGTNFFYDQQFRTGHQRFGIGFEIKSSVYDFNLNFYDASSSIKDIAVSPALMTVFPYENVSSTIKFSPSNKPKAKLSEPDSKYFMNKVS